MNTIRIVWVGWILTLLLAVMARAQAPMVLQYNGSFNLPNASAWSDYYYNRMAFVTNGTPRPAWGGSPVTGPTMITYNNYTPYCVREFNNLPALSKTAAGLGTAVLLTNSAGGTAYTGRSPSFVDGAGILWAPENYQPYYSDKNNGLFSPYYNPGAAMLGGTTAPSVTPDTNGWLYSPAYYPMELTLRRGNGTGGLYTDIGTNVGAHFLCIGNQSANNIYGVTVWDAQRTSSNTVVGTQLFTTWETSFNDGNRPVQYVRDVSHEHEWFLLYNINRTGGSNSFPLTFFNASVTGNVMPNITYDIGPAIVNGAGWLSPSSGSAIYVAWDWDHSQLYVLDGGTSAGSGSINRQARVHVFTIASMANIQNASVSYLTNSASMAGYLPAQTADAVCYWGTTDGGTNTAGWANTNDLGTVTGPAYLTNSVSGLTAGQGYFFRYFATNSVGGNWATNSTYFLTMGGSPAPLVDNTGGGVALAPGSELLQGKVSQGTPSPNVWIYWGTIDGGTDRTAWAAANTLTAVFGPFSVAITNLLANQQYWYRCYASNSVGDAWAPASTNFTAMSPVLSIGTCTVVVANLGSTTNAVVPVTLSVPSAVSVSATFATSSGSANAAGTYVSTNGTLTIPAGSTNGQILVTTIGTNTYSAPVIIYVNLSSPSNVTLGNTQGVITILSDNHILYVRNANAGIQNGYTWATAFTNLQAALTNLTASDGTFAWTIMVEATTNNKAYAPASLTANFGYFCANLAGGWLSVDVAPTQSGYSVVSGSGSARGLDIEAPGNQHNQPKTIGVGNFIFTNVTDGIYVLNPGNLQNSVIALSLSNSRIFASSNGVVASYCMGGGGTALNATNVTVVAGTSGAGQGVWLQGWLNTTNRLANVQVTTRGGAGVRVDYYGNGFIFNNGINVALTDVAVTNCYAGGITITQMNNVAWNYTAGQVGNSVFSLNRVQLCNNGGFGLYASINESQGAAYPAVAMQLFATNALIASNAWDGVFLDGAETNWTAVGGLGNVQLMNCTVANNGSNGVRVASNVSAGNGITNWIVCYNTLFYGNGADGARAADTSAGGPAIAENHNDFYQNAGSVLTRIGQSTNHPAADASDLQVNPMLFALQPTPYRPAYGSPLLHAGVSANAPPVDILLAPRSSTPTIGCYEMPQALLRGSVIYFH